jgi:cytochrome c oxidase cbb3-type subunit 1
MVPRLWYRARVYSVRMIEWHFWIATIGIVLYITPLWIAGIMQGLMWRAYDNLGFLQFSFVESVTAMHPYYLVRTFAGVLFLLGALIMVYNMWRTIRGDVRLESAIGAAAPVAA